ncbi:hypothetical protein ACH4GM_12230 [Streptomyces coeruleorubidus]
MPEPVAVGTRIALPTPAPPQALGPSPPGLCGRQAHEVRLNRLAAWPSA